MRSKFNLMMVLLAFLSTSISSASFFPNGPAFVMGGHTFDLSALVVLKGGCTSGSVNLTFQSQDATTGAWSAYQVPGSKTLTIWAIVPQGQPSTSALALWYTVLYADNNVGINSSTAFTTPHYDGADDSNASGGATYTTASWQGQNAGAPLYFVVPTGKYPGAICQTGVRQTVTAYAEVH